MLTLVNVDVPKHTIKIVDKPVEVNFTITQKEYLEKKREVYVIVEKRKLRVEEMIKEVVVENLKYNVVEMER